MASGGGSSAPAPDYAGAAQQQGQSSKEVTNMQTYANRPDQYTPWGAETWQNYSAVDPSTGQNVTRWTQQQQLAPQLQGALDDQLQIQRDKSQLAGGFAGRVAESYQQPFDWTNVPNAAGTPNARLSGTYDVQGSVPQYGMDINAPSQTTYAQGEPGFTAERQRIEQGLFDRMRPEHQFQEDRTRTMLANQGLTPGSEAYNRELQRLGESQAGERFNALQMGGAEQARLHQMNMAQQQQAFGQDVTGQQAYNQALQAQFGQGLQAGTFYNQAGQQQFGQEMNANQQNYNQMMQQAEYQNRLRQQGITEQQLQRQMPLNEMNALMTGAQVQSPNMPQFQSAQAAQPVQSLAAATAQGNYQSQLAAQNAQSQSGLWQGLGSLAGSAAGLYALGAFSDVRLKTNIKRIGTHPRGVGIYSYEIFGRPEVGVMAQELMHVAPWLVGVRDGYFTVNYGGL